MGQRQFKNSDTDLWIHGFGNRADGDVVISADTTDAPIDSACLGSSGAFTLSATNVSFAAGQLILIHQTYGNGAWELNKIESYVAGTITLSYPLMNAYTSGAQVLVIKQYGNFTINTTKTLTAKAWNGSVGGIVAMFCDDTFTTLGTGRIDVSGRSASGGTPGARMGFEGGNDASGPGYAGEGTGGATVQQYTANGNGGGGGKAGSSRGGAGGGNGATGGYDGGTGDPGNATGLTDLTLATFGGGGGGTGASGSGGGGGAGIVFLFARNINLSGTSTISLAGGNGGSGGSYGGGGGAGGSALLKCVTAALGTGVVIAAGGSRGTGGTNNGGAGAVGRVHLDYVDSYTGTTTPGLDASQDSTLLDQGGAFFLE